MKSRNAQRWLQYGVSALVGLALSLTVAVSRGLSGSVNLAWNARYLSDGFFVAGLLMACFGVLMLIATTDFFDIFAYGLRNLVAIFAPMAKTRQAMKYYEFKESRAERRGKKRFFVLVTGLAYLGLALACLWVYYNC